MAEQKNGQIAPVDISKFIPQLKNMYMAGFTEKEMLETLKIGREVLTKIKNTDGFKELSDKWKGERISNVENKLYEKCMGFKETTKFDSVVKIRDSEGAETSSIEELSKETYYQPDFQSIKMYLLNKAGDQWKDKSELVIDTAKDMSMDELESKVATFLKEKHDKKIQRKKDLANNLAGIPTEESE